jgi:hypothetical protein
MNKCIFQNEDRFMCQRSEKFPFYLSSYKKYINIIRSLEQTPQKLSTESVFFSQSPHN